MNKVVLVSLISWAMAMSAAAREPLSDLVVNANVRWGAGERK